MPNIQHRPENVREHLARHGLFMNEPVIICRSCKFSLGDSPNAVANHLAEKHNVPQSSYSFVGDPANGLAEAYLELSRRACLATVNGVIMDHDWNMVPVRRYLDWYDHITRLLVLSVYLLVNKR